MKNTITAVALLALSASAAADDSFSMSAGFEYSSGTYGNAESTRILYIPVTATYETGKWTAELTVPYLRITGPGGVLPGYGRMSTTTATSSMGVGRNPGGGTTTSSGLGDIVASVGRTVYGMRDEDFWLDLVGTVKLGTADANQGLGTGANDYSAQFDAGWGLTETTSLLGTAGYKIVGAPAGIPVNNVAFGSIGAEHETSDTTSLGLKFDYEQKVTAAGYDQKAATLYVWQKLDPGLKLMAYALKGFSDGSPDYGFGATVTSAF